MPSSAAVREASAASQLSQDFNLKHQPHCSTVQEDSLHGGLDLHEHRGCKGKQVYEQNAPSLWLYLSLPFMANIHEL